MVKIITYGTYDVLHYGHISLLARAKALGDYLIVGVTADDFDKTRGKINVQQSLMERIEAVRATGLADEIIIEEFEGQKIDDIRRLDVDIFTVGCDWIGKFDYLNDYCRVVYLDRTEGISSSGIRAEERTIRLGLIGDTQYIKKFYRESAFVNGAVVNCIWTDEELTGDKIIDVKYADTYEELLKSVDAVYIVSTPSGHSKQIEKALLMGKHVLCEAPISLNLEESRRLLELAKLKKLIILEGLKTAYSTAYYRLLLLLKTGIIGRVVAVDATCTTLRNKEFIDSNSQSRSWNSITAWGPTAMLPVFQILGTNFIQKHIISLMTEGSDSYDIFTKIDFVYQHAVASIKVGKGVKSEGELIVSGTKGYLYVPAPWWKTDYFEVRFEDSDKNRRYFYSLDGEGIRYEIVAFIKAIKAGKSSSYISEEVTETITRVLGDFYQNKDVTRLSDYPYET